MNVLALEASPRRAGITTKLLEALLEEVQKNGHTVDLVRVSDLNIAPCKGCLYCRKKEVCLVQDDAQKIHGMIDGSDALIVASPTYWGNMPSSLKCLFDRSVFVFESFASRIPQPRQTGKKAIILTACGSPYPISHLRTQGAGSVRNIRTVLHNGGYSVVGTMIRSGAAKSHEVTKKDLQRARRLAWRLG